MVIWVVPTTLVLLTTSLRTLQIRIKIGSYLAKVNNCRLVGNHPATRVMMRWKRFTQTGGALVLVTTFVAAMYIYTVSYLCTLGSRTVCDTLCSDA